MPTIGDSNSEAQPPDAKKPDGSQEHSQIVAGTAKHGIQTITEAAVEPIPTQPAFIFHVTDHRFYGTSSMNGFPDGRGDAPLLAAAPDRYAIDTDAPTAFVDKHRLWFLRGENALLLNGFRQRVIVVGCRSGAG